MADVYSDEEWAWLSEEEKAAAVVDYNLQRAEELGLDQNRVAATMNTYVDQGVDPVTALDAAVAGHDHSEDADEMAALERISAREGWS